ncbi:MAG: hypothetical protein ABI607_15760 [Betaproteobacteria bacterium]
MANRAHRLQHQRRTNAENPISVANRAHRLQHQRRTNAENPISVANRAHRLQRNRRPNPRFSHSRRRSERHQRRRL